MSTTGNVFQVPHRVINYRRRVLEFQRALWNSAFDAAGRLQEQRHDLYARWIDRIPGLPAESREILDTWTNAAARGRETLRNTMDRSFDLMESYYDRLTEASEKPAEEPAPAA